MNEKVATKIVADGITGIPQVQSLYVMHDLCKDNPPNPDDRAYFSVDNDLRNHIYTQVDFSTWKNSLHCSQLGL